MFNINKAPKLHLIITIFLVTLLLYLPIIFNPSILLNRGNDLDEFFWPIIYFVKQQILQTHQLPLWNNLFLSGMPLLPDPQSPLFYPPHFIFLIFPVDYTFIISFLLHIFLAGIGAYVLARYGLGLSTPAGFFSSFLYIASPKLAGFLEAGHSGLVWSWAFLPFIALATLKLAQKPKFVWSGLLGLSLAAVFYTHTIIFIISAIAAGLLLLMTATISPIKKGVFRSAILFFLLAILLTFGLAAITLLPQIEWVPQTTRFLLLQDRDVYPKWTGVIEFVKVALTPLILGKEGIWNLDSEKWIPLGTSTSVLALFGLLGLKRRIVIPILGSGLLVAFIALNNISPIYQFLIKQDWYVLSRVSTRVWFIPVLLVTFLAGYGFNLLIKRGKSKFIPAIVAFFVLAELVTLSWLRLSKPIPEQTKFAPREIYEFLTNDKEKFRVFCLNRCLSQKEAVIYGLELVEGYNTLQQTNYYKHIWQLSGAYWNYYTLSLPPVGTYTFERLKPDVISLGVFNVKYIISPYQLDEKALSLEKEIGEYFIYKNNIVLPRAYFWTDEQKPGGEALIIKYSPNHIRVDASRHETSRLVLAEVASPGWNAYLNGKEKMPVQEKPDTLRLVNIKPDTNFVDFKYEPKGYSLGKTMTLATIFGLAFGAVVFRQWKK